MVSLRALTAAPLETAPRPVLAMALVRTFCTELLAPALAAGAVLVPPPATVNALVICVPVAAPPEVLTYMSASDSGLCQ